MPASFRVSLLGAECALSGWLVLLYGVLLMSCFLYCSMNWANRQTSPSVVRMLASLQILNLYLASPGRKFCNPPAYRDRCTAIFGNWQASRHTSTGRVYYPIPNKLWHVDQQVGMYLFVIIGVVLVSYGRPPCDEELLKSSGSEKEEVIACELESGTSTDDDDKLE